ncbi:LicD family protein [Butyrivibrio sp. INlla14]|uniref:LicD family protein n=1 Tax=Butyrivibrio sp. INlla14 TaxID=1520808 RepID=UPI000876A096|nr:LicD family protein [Butyrivibrio sp. INlla14]SCY34028.1 Phosphorylcholine metabolism protein LicD [Butyrivibrio sp. INlla14]
MRHGVDFFRDEIRNGFYIPTAVKQSWAAALDVLWEIDRICCAHNIRYFADWGSFLGAVRHGGFVPWDDDLDICMLRDDYEKFRAVCDAELPDNYCIHDYERHQGHWLFLARVVNNNHIRFDDEHLLNNYNFPWLSGVDIFLKDYLYDDPAKEKERDDRIMRLLAEAEPYITELEKTSGDKGSISPNDISGRTGNDAGHNEAALIKAVDLYRRAESIMAEVASPSEIDEKTGSNNTHHIGQIFPWILKGGKGEKLEYYKETVYLPFEDTLIPVPACYNKVLSGRYGDYNVVKKGVAGHDYPSFEGQRKAFESETGAALPQFSFDKKMLERPEPFCNDKGRNLNPAEAASASCSEQMAVHERNRREVLFLPVGPSEWKSLENSFIKECADSDTDVYVVPLPLMHRDFYGRIQSTDEEILEAEHFEDYVRILEELESRSRDNESGENDCCNNEAECGWNRDGEKCDTKICHDESSDENSADAGSVNLDHVYLVGFTDFDLAEHCPDRIYIQNPYDEWNPVLTVPEYYYSRNLRNFTRELIYIPIGPVGEYTENDLPDMLGMQFYVLKPGVIYADKVLVQSENIRSHYVKALTEFALGENTSDLCNISGQVYADNSNKASEKIEYRNYWENKIIATRGLYGFDGRQKEESKKEILFGIAPYEYFENKDRFEEALRERIKIFKENADKVEATIYLYQPKVCVPGGTDTCSNELELFYAKVKSLAGEATIDVVYGSREMTDSRAAACFVSSFTAYYGSSLPIVQEFIAQKKPVMIANYEL